MNRTHTRALGALMPVFALAMTVCAGTAGASTGAATTGQVLGAQPPSNEAEFCRRTGIEVALPEEGGVRQASADLAREAKIWQELKAFAPIGLRSDLDLLARNYDALSTGAKTFPEADPEVRPAFARVMEHRKAVC